MKKIIFCVLIIVSMIFGCKKQVDQEKLVVFHAGSLSVPFRQVAAVFEEQNR